METISCKEARDHMAEVINEVAYGHKRYKLTRRGNGIAVMISIDDWEEFERLKQIKEDKEDIHDAAIALKRIKKEGGIPLKKMKKELGL